MKYSIVSIALLCLMLLPPLMPNLSLNQGITAIYGGMLPIQFRGIAKIKPTAPIDQSHAPEETSEKPASETAEKPTAETPKAVILEPHSG